MSLLYDPRREKRALSARQPMWRNRVAKFSEASAERLPAQPPVVLGSVSSIAVCHSVILYEGYKGVVALSVVTKI